MMDLLHDIADTVADLDLVKENINGVFANLTLLSMVLSSITKNKPFPKTKETIGRFYDYIIVGAGPAGCVMANRLSKNSCRKVLLLEAGDDTPLLTDIPGYARLFHKTSVDWAYETEPQKYAARGLRDNKVTWNSGKGLGGSTMINAMLYVRGNKKNYDMWAAEGCTGWDYKGVKPYFLKLEDNIYADELDPGYHQKGGPQTVERANYVPEIKIPILEALAEKGYEERDVNGRRQTGAFGLQTLYRNQQRCSAAKAYLVPAEDRPNLDIVKGAFVKKIIIKNKRAVGVEYDHHFLSGTAYARKEVIVSCGSVRTAQLLMLSGIGPSEELSKFNINEKANLPVGKNLQDHVASYLYYQLDDKIMNLYAKNLNPANVIDYTVNRHGPLAAPTQFTALAFTNGLNGTNDSTDFPTQGLYFAEYAVLDTKVHGNLKEGVFEKYFAPYVGKPICLCISSLLQTKSFGQITLKSTNPYDAPLINPNYLQDESDLRAIVEGLKLCNAVAKSGPMQKVQATPIPIAFPGCEEEFEEGNETEYLRCYARHLTYSVWHPCGTARMGQPNDSRSVVDPQLRVIGLKGLRVVNAAVMPIIPSGNTNVPTLMVAEKAYDLMKDDCKCPDISTASVETSTVDIPTVPVDTSTVGIGLL